MNYISFEPRKWQADTSVNSNGNKIERVFVTDMCGGLTEVYCIGDWHKNLSQIKSESMMLKENSDYVFTFWLNGGENDRRQETCKLKVYMGDADNPLVFRLNRQYIKPDKYNGGWYRYKIPFNVGDTDGEEVPVTLQFCAMDAHCAIMPDKQEFAQLPDEEQPDKRIPQRHNIVFTDGWPRDSKWSYLVFGDETSYQNTEGNHYNQHRIDSLIAMGMDFESMFDDMDSGDKSDLFRDIFGMNFKNN